MTKRIWLTIIASMLFAAAIACPAIAETTAAKKKKPTPTSTATRTPTPTPTPAPQVWISTTGIVATGSSKSHADAPSSEAANSSVVVPSALAE